MTFTSAPRWCHEQRRLPAVAAVLLASAITFLPAPAAAGPWTPEPGEGYVKLWLKWYYGLGFRDGNGTNHDIGNYNELFVATYGEVGVLPRLAFFWNTDLLRTFYLQDPSTGDLGVHTGPGDPAAGLRYQFLSAGRFVMAAETWARAPLANDDAVQPVRSTDPGNPIVGALRLGAGAWDVGAGMSAGYGWDHFYAAAFGSYIFRSDDYDGVVNWSAEGGYGGESGFSIRARVLGYHSLANGTARRHNSPSGQGNGTNYIGFAIETDWELWPHNWLGVSFEGGIAALRRQGGGPVITVYYAQRF